MEYFTLSTNLCIHLTKAVMNMYVFYMLHIPFQIVDSPLVQE